MREKKFTKGDWKAYNRGNLYGESDVFEIHFSDDGERIITKAYGGCYAGD